MDFLGNQLAMVMGWGNFSDVGDGRRGAETLLHKKNKWRGGGCFDLDKFLGYAKGRGWL